MGEEAMGEEPPQGAAAGGGPGGAGDPGAAAPAASVKPIYCNFGFDARAEDVRAAFAEHGVVARVDIKQRYAFVFMETQEAAEAAVEKLHETEFGPEGPDGRRRRLVVNFARVRIPPPPPPPPPPRLASHRQAGGSLTQVPPLPGILPIRARAGVSGADARRFRLALFRGTAR